MNTDGSMPGKERQRGSDGGGPGREFTKGGALAIVGYVVYKLIAIFEGVLRRAMDAIERGPPPNVP